jgi:hypothetical protein
MNISKEEKNLISMMSKWHDEGKYTTWAIMKLTTMGFSKETIDSLAGKAVWAMENGKMSIKTGEWLES